MKHREPKTTKIEGRIEIDTWEAIQQVSALEHRSAWSVIRQAVAEWLILRSRTRRNRPPINPGAQKVSELGSTGNSVVIGTGGAFAQSVTDGGANV